MVTFKDNLIVGLRCCIAVDDNSDGNADVVHNGFTVFIVYTEIVLVPSTVKTCLRKLTTNSFTLIVVN